MVVETAKAGRGSHSIVNDNDCDKLDSLVVDALGKSFEPSLKGCKLTWNYKTEDLGEVYRESTIFRNAIMSKDQFLYTLFMFKFYS